MKICSIIGARPQFIKVAAFSREIREKAQEVIIHTGQHYDDNLSPIFFRELMIPEPDYNLNVGSSSHGKQTGQMLERIENVLKIENPDMVLVYGDTNTTLAGALAAAKLHYPLGHIEAGLRSYNREMPEEINRVVTDHLSDLLFCPTQASVDNLKREGITRGAYLTGDVMYDTLIFYRKKSNKKLRLLKKLGVKPQRYLLLTIHRAENTDNVDNLKIILGALSTLNVPIVFPAHPRTLAVFKKQTITIGDNIIMINPVGYLEMIILESNAMKILTDSGGVQKESYILKIPCITLRNETEWIETVEDGWNIVVEADPEKILEAVRTFEPSRRQRKLFGDGHAAGRIATHVQHYIRSHYPLKTKASKRVMSPEG